MSGPLDPTIYTTISNYKYGAENAFVQHNPFLAALKQKMRVKEKQGGVSITWPIEAGRYVAFGSAPGDDMSGRFNVAVRHQLPVLPWADIRGAAAIDYGTLRRNYGDQALVKLSETEAPAVFRDMLTNGSSSLNGRLLNENITTSTDPLPLAGLPSFLLSPGATGLQGYDGGTTFTGVAPAATDVMAAPGAVGGTSQTYATLSMQPSGLTAVDNPVFDAWMPQLVNTEATVLNTVAKWTQFGVTRAGRFDGGREEFNPDFGILDRGSFYTLGTELTTLNSGFTVLANLNQEATNKFGTGFKVNNLLFHAGLMWMWDLQCPTGGYVINASQMWFMKQPIFNTFDSGNDLPVSRDVAGIPDVELIEQHLAFNPLVQQIMIAGNLNVQLCANPRYQVRMGPYVP